MREHALALRLGEREAARHRLDRLERARLDRLVLRRPDLVDELREGHLGDRGLDRVLDLHPERAVVSGQGLVPVDFVGALVVALGSSADVMPLHRGGGDHPVEAGEVKHQRLDLQRAGPDLGVGHDDPRLHDVAHLARADVGRDPGEDDLQVHAVLGDLAGVHVERAAGRFLQDGQHDVGEVPVVERAVAVGQEGPDLPVEGPDHPLLRLAAEPAVDVVGQQLGVLLQAAVVVGRRDLHALADLAVGQGADRVVGRLLVRVQHAELHGLVGRDHAQAAGVAHEVALRLQLALQLLGQLDQGSSGLHGSVSFRLW